MAQQQLARRASTTSISKRSSLAPSIRCSRSSSTIFITHDALPDGALVGVGQQIQGERMQLVPNITVQDHHQQPSQTLQIQRRLGTGSYAVVYLAREVLSPHAATSSALLSSDPEHEDAPITPTALGREFAVKCLSKSALDAEGLEAQMQEARIQQSLPIHPNVVTLYRTLETSSYLLLVMEYVPGSDLFYFLEQARDHEDLLPQSANSTTPPTPSLLLSLHPSQILSPRRLKLISSMFSQMCDAVAHCHENGISHRDVKPENFMVTERTTGENGERSVVVKLTDFGLATRDAHSGDMDCGSAPYMSFECHNNLTPTYATAPADVWSLGIVLINMLYHANPWLTTASSECQSFDHFLRDPLSFFMDRFTGMTEPVAHFFSQRVFCLLDPSHHPYLAPSTVPDDLPTSRRVTAAEFGEWARDQFPILLGPKSRRRSQTPPPPNSSRPLSSEIQLSLSQPAARSRTPSPIQDRDMCVDVETRSTSGNSKRRKRAARGHGKSNCGSVSASVDGQDRLSHLADASQRIAREASSLIKHPLPPAPVSVAVQTTTAQSAGPQLRSKKSTTKWAGIFTRRDSGSDQDAIMDAPPLPPVVDIKALSPRKSVPNLSSTVNNISSVIRSLDPPPLPQVESPLAMEAAFANAFNAISTAPQSAPNSASSRGRKKEKIEAPTKNKDALGLVLGGKLRYTVGQERQTIVASSKSHDGIGRGRSMSPVPIPPVPEIPSSYRHGGAPSIRSNSSWRTSSSASSISGSSTYTRYSNASMRSVSTAATSLSSGSRDWRRKEKLPGNIKPMTGIPWELGEVPRQQFAKPEKHVFSPAPGYEKQQRRQHHHVHASAKVAMELTTIAEGSRPSSGKDRPSEQQQALLPDNRKNPGLTIDPVVANNNEGTGMVDKPLKTPTKSRLWSWRSNK